MKHHEWPSESAIKEAHLRIAPYIHKTPVLTSSALDRLTGASLFFKCENFQRVGAFKMRGASNAVFSLTNAHITKGVATHSSGNHAQAVALAASLRGAKAYIVMPKNAPKVKVEAVKEYGATITFCEPNQGAREATLQQIIDQTGAYFIHPYNDYEVICGQATCAKELLEEQPTLNCLIAPIGGGGLMSGTCLWAHYFNPAIQLFGAEPEGANDAFRSLQSGAIVPSVNPQTISDGLLSSLGEKTFSILKELLNQIFTVTDQEIIEAMKLIYERLKIVIEPSCATAFAIVLKNKEHFKGKKVGIILTGGNVDLQSLPF